jgi:tetratricopeptide (TPR) repeat protein
MEDKTTADLCLNLSKAFRRNGDLSKAEKYVKAARRIFQRFYGKGSLQAARALRQYAEIMSDLGRIDTAVRLVNQSLRICHNRADQSAEAASCDLLGKIYNKAEKYAEAVPPLESALSIRRSINPKAADTANTLHHLGMAYGKTGRIAGAVSAFTEALDIRRSVFQGDHIQTAAALSRLGDVYRSAEDYDQAFACYHQAFEMFKDLSALDHPFAGSTYLGLGYCYKRMGRADDAAMAFNKAYRLCIQEYGPDHPHTLEVKKQVH